MSRTAVFKTAFYDDEDRLDLGAVAGVLRRQWKVILGITLGFVLAAVAFLIVVPPTYTSTAQILIDPRKSKVFGTDAVNSEPVLDTGFVESQVSVLLSTKLLNTVVEREKLAGTDEFGDQSGGMLRSLLALFTKAPSAVVDTEGGVSARNAQIIDRLREHVDVQRIGKGNVLTATVSSRSPERAARLANALADAFLDNQLQVSSASVRAASERFADRLDDLREQLRRSERSLSEFRTRNNILTAGSEGKITVNEQQLAQLNVKLAEATLDTSEKIARYEQARRVTMKAGKLEDLPEAMAYGSIPQLRAQRNDLARKEEDLLATVGPLFPSVANLRAERVGIERALIAEVGRLLTTLKHDADTAQAREGILKDSIQRLSNASGRDSDVGVELRELERVNLANRTLFEGFLARAKQAQEQAGFEEQGARLISPALTPRLPSSPKTVLTLAVALSLGLISGLLCASILEFSSHHRFAIRKLVEESDDESEAYPAVVRAVGLPDFQEPLRAQAPAPVVPAPLPRVDNVVAPPVEHDISVDEPVASPATPVRASSATPERPALPLPPKSPILHGSMSVFGSDEGTDRTIRRSGSLPNGRRFACSLSRLMRVAAMSREDREQQVMLLTSAAGAEGTAIVSAALALTAANEGWTVLLVDGDARHKELSRAMGVADRPGLFDLLDADADADEFIQPFGRIDMLPAGVSYGRTFEDDDIRRRVGELHLARSHPLVIIDGGNGGTDTWRWLTPIVDVAMAIDDPGSYLPSDALGAQLAALFQSGTAAAAGSARS